MQKLSSIFSLKYFLKYGVMTILLAVPLYPKFPIFNLPGTYVAIRAEDFLIVALTFCWLIYFAKSNKKQFFNDKINIAIFLFIWVGLLSVISAIFLTQTVTPALGILHWVRRIEYILPLFIAIAAIKNGLSLKLILICIFISTVLTFIYGFGQMHFSWPVISTQNEEYAKGIALRWIPGSRLHSTFSGHYDLAAFLLIIFPIAVAFYFTLQTLVKKVVFVLIVFSPSLWLLLQTEARVTFVAYLLSVSVTIILIGKKNYILPFMLISILGMLMFSDLGQRYINTFNVYKHKVLILDKLSFDNSITVFAQESSPKPVIEDRSTSIRLNIEWPRAIRAFFKNPLLGTGYSSISLATDNDYLRLLGETGLVGTLAFLTVILELSNKLKAYYQKFKTINLRKVFIAGFIGSLIGILMNAAFIDVFEASKVAIIFWTLAGVAISQTETEYTT